MSANNLEGWSYRPVLPLPNECPHGWGDTNGGFGVTYPCDLDEFEKSMEGHEIPDGMVEVYGFWGLPNGYELIVPEKLYLEELLAAIKRDGRMSCHADLIKVVQQMRNLAG